MDHSEASELFSAYRDKELAPEKAKALEEHLGSCVTCRRDFEKFERAVEGVRNLPPVDAPPQFAAGVVRRLRQRSGGRLFQPRRLSDRVPFELLSLVMLALVLAIYLFFQMTQPGRLNLP